MKRKAGRALREPEASAGEFVYEHLRRRIVSREIPEGTLLVEQDVATALRVSRTPVHDALRRLGAEGLLEVSPRRRARVSRVTQADIEQLYEIRSSLECIATQHAARHIEESTLLRLEEENAAMEEIARNWSASRTREFTEANARFHLLILDAARNRWLEQTLRPVLDMLLGPVSALANQSPEAAADVRQDLVVENLLRNCCQHREIVDSLRIGSTSLAGVAMKLHVETAHRDWGGAAERQKTVAAAMRGRHLRRDQETEDQENR
jgi:DNA-binding GntR family transcriptional regulator